MSRARLAKPAKERGSADEIQRNNGKIPADYARTVKVDVACDNGVNHVIDKVILPE